MAPVTTETVQEWQTPDPLKFRDVAKQLRSNGFSYVKSRCAYIYKDAMGVEWVARLRETEWGVNIDTHYIDSDGLERVV